jgi:hypothetical protein
LSQQAVLDFIVDEVIIAEQLATRCWDFSHKSWHKMV